MSQSTGDRSTLIDAAPTVSSKATTDSQAKLLLIAAMDEQLTSVSNQTQRCREALQSLRTSTSLRDTEKAVTAMLHSLKNVAEASETMSQAQEALRFYLEYGTLCTTGEELQARQAAVQANINAAESHWKSKWLPQNYPVFKRALEKARMDPLLLGLPASELEEPNSLARRIAPHLVKCTNSPASDKWQAPTFEVDGLIVDLPHESDPQRWLIGRTEQEKCCQYPEWLETELKTDFE